MAINDQGQIVVVSDQTGFGYNTSTFLWDDGVWTNVVTDDFINEGEDLNNAGQVPGWSNSLSRFSVAWLWDDGVKTGIPSLGGFQTKAHGINEAGHVVGEDPTSGDPWRVWHGWLWKDGELTDLGTLVDGGHSWAFDINDQGWIVGSATNRDGASRAVLWSGAPPPPPPPGFDFTESVSPASGSVAPGETASATVTATLTSGSPREVQYSCTNLPSGTSCEFIPPACSPTCSSALGVHTSTTTPPGTYPVTIMASDGSVSRSTTFTLTVTGTSTLSFRKGDGGAYSETDDAFLYSGAPNTNYGSNAALFVDAADCIARATICRTLISFPSFIGPNAGQVPTDATIISATLELTVTNAGGTQLLYQVAEGWTESGVTWNAFATPGMPKAKGSTLSFGAPLGTIRINITAIVQNWVNGDTNLGVFIWSTSANGADYGSSESASPPKLIVTFRQP
jgi:probable HAF family extracellular repeat protein